MLKGLQYIIAHEARLHELFWCSVIVLPKWENVLPIHFEKALGHTGGLGGRTAQRHGTLVTWFQEGQIFERKYWSFVKKKQ